MACETDGTLVATDGTMRALSAAARPPSGRSTTEVLADLAEALGASRPETDPAAIRRALATDLGIDPGALEAARAAGAVLPGFGPAADGTAPIESGGRGAHAASHASEDEAVSAVLAPLRR